MDRPGGQDHREPRTQMTRSRRGRAVILIPSTVGVVVVTFTIAVRPIGIWQAILQCAVDWSLRGTGPIPLPELAPPHIEVVVDSSEQVTPVGANLGIDAVDLCQRAAIVPLDR